MKSYRLKLAQTLFAGLLFLFAGSMDIMAQAKKGGAARKPANTQRAAAKPAARPAAKPAAKSTAKPANTQRPAAKPSTTAKSSNAQRSNVEKSGVNKPGNNNQQAGKSIGNKNDGGGKNTNISGNKVNVDKSRGDVNINIDKSKDIKVKNTRNTVSRRNTYRPPYSRPPYRYGGYSYHCYHPFVYHPYRPFVWGPRWHPWGFFITTLAVTAIIVSFADADLPPVMHSGEYFVWTSGALLEQTDYMRSGPNEMQYGPLPAAMPLQDGEYYYDEGVFYLKGEGGYTVVAAPLGGVIKSLPEGYETVDLDEAGTVKNYYFGGAFYEKTSKGYKVVPPTSGVVVKNLPDGGEEVKMGDITYVKLGETYYQPVKEKGQDMYEVVDAEKDK